MISSSSDTMIKLQNVNKSYRLDNEIIFYALKNINIRIEAGEFCSIMGPSGSGKSTLMHIIGLLDKPSSGKVFLDNQEISNLEDDEISRLRNEFTGFVFQQFNLIPKLTVLENIILPAFYCRKSLSFEPKEKALELLRRFGLEEKKNSYPNKLSGGQQQMVAIARALIMNPRLILADEPTGNIDSRSGREVMKLIDDLNHKEKITVILVTHDLDIAKHAKRTIKIKDGQII